MAPTSTPFSKRFLERWSKLGKLERLKIKMKRRLWKLEWWIAWPRRDVALVDIMSVLYMNIVNLMLILSPTSSRGPTAGSSSLSRISRSALELVEVVGSSPLQFLSLLSLDLSLSGSETASGGLCHHMYHPITIWDLCSWRPDLLILDFWQLDVRPCSYASRRSGRRHRPFRG